MFLKKAMRTKLLYGIIVHNLISLSIGFFNQVAASDDTDDEIEEITKMAGKTAISNPLTLARYSGTAPLVKYTQKLTTKKSSLDTKRKSTIKSIKYVCKAASQDGNKTHILAQGICRGAVSTWPDPLTTINLPQNSKTSPKLLDWVSKESETNSDDKICIRKPEASGWGGHAEVQLIADLDDVFNMHRETFLELFLPPSDSTESIYMCGLELFGPYDMCDKYNDKGNNKYNCVGKLLDFRKKHQKGQKSISRAIRDKLKDRFKGEKEDAFVMIYHAQSPYVNVDSYSAENDEYLYSLQYVSDGCRFLRKKDFDDSYSLSQVANIDIEPDVLYGYIHQLADKTATYQESSHHFSFL